MNEVTPSIMLEGTKANPIHLSRLSTVGLLVIPVGNDSPEAPPTATPPASPPSSAAEASEAGRERHSTTAEANTKTTRTPYPIVHINPWLASLRLGSTMTGYPKSPITLPRFDARYKK
jgi:hypothetical protein